MLHADYATLDGVTPLSTVLSRLAQSLAGVFLGERREGGSFSQRICKYSSWNSYGSNSVYLTKTVNTFLSA